MLIVSVQDIKNSDTNRPPPPKHNLYNIFAYYKTEIKHILVTILNIENRFGVLSRL